MERDGDGRDGTTVHTTCPLRCGLRRAAADDGHFDDHVDWAGLPVNLDLVFSREQREKVYKQHQLRKRGIQQRDGALMCVCDATADLAEHERRPMAPAAHSVAADAR